MSWTDNIDRVIRRHMELSDRMSTGTLPAEEFQAVSMEYAELTPIVEAAQTFRAAEAERTDLVAMIEDHSSDKEMRSLAREELESLDERLPELEQDLKLLLRPKDEADRRACIMEIRAGTGGDEAGLFAGDLLRMYQRYCQNHSWPFEVIDISENEVGGIAQVTVSINGAGAYGKLKFESGVHRVQRVPTTESGGRIHTSAATVAVLPEAQEVDIEINEGDLRVDTYRSQGAGGQHVNTTDSAIRITHLPTGLVVTCQDEKSQHKNRAKAMKVLRARLYDQERERQASERAADRKSMVGSGDRSERIRTYNFPQGRVTDHRINLTLYKLDRMMLGEALDEILDALILEDQSSLLAELGEAV